MDSYLSTQRSTIFQHVAVLIYVFDIETREAVKDLEYYRDCIDGLKKYSSEARVFLLVHKMDLVRENVDDVLIKKRAQLEQESTGLTVTVFGTSIYNESLYRVRCFINLPKAVISSFCALGLVPYRPHSNPQRKHPIETPLNPCTSVQCHRGHPLRTHNISCGCYFHRSRQRSRRPSPTRRHSLRTNLGVDQSVQILVHTGPRRVPFTRDGTLRVHCGVGRTHSKHLRLDHCA